MHILADQDINTVAEHFRDLGELRLFEGRKLTAALLGDAEVLLVRSVTRVTTELIRDSRLRFIGSATAGIDHIDTVALAAAGIHFADAAGCNARAVAEHVVTCLYLQAAHSGRAVGELRVGIIGCGHVGRSLIRLLDRLGIAHVDHDPPRAAREPGFVSAALVSVLACEVVTLHVPLIKDGPWPTVNLLDREIIAALNPDTLVINAARGGVLDEDALAVRLSGKGALVAAIDCWLGEPLIDTGLLRLAWLATPHLAGHSREARLGATRALWQAYHTWRGTPCGASPVTLPAIATAHDYSARDGVAALLASVYPIVAHDTRLRAGLVPPNDARGAHFDEIRRLYALRREFGAYRVACAEFAPDTVAELTALGFNCAAVVP